MGTILAPPATLPFAPRRNTSRRAVPLRKAGQPPAGFVFSIPNGTANGQNAPARGDFFCQTSPAPGVL
jgi:hypothetical protein